MKVVEREEARRLREQNGLAMRVIAGRLGVAVSSVSRWTRDIALTAEQQDELRRSNRLVDAQRIGREAMRRSARMRRLEAQEHGRALARRGDPLHVAGCMLFWAEGSKRHLGNGLDLADIEEWWLRRLKLPRTCLRAHTLNRASSASRGKRRTLPRGTARIVVCSTFIVQSIYGSIQEYAGFRRREFLD